MSEAAVPPILSPSPHPFWHGVRAGWRPAAGWVCVGILLVNGVVLQLARFWGFQAEPLHWDELTPFVGTLMGLGVMRTVEKVCGATI